MVGEINSYEHRRLIDLMPRIVSPKKLPEQHWPPDSNPLVRILCLTYNHAAFIGQCIEAFLMQKTSFPVQIVVHDDASTDGTQDILREYAAQHPGLFRLFLQTENQFSRGLIAPIDFGALPPARYTAVCEGDDFWVDENKLQIQADFLESHPEYSVSGHDCERAEPDGSMTGKFYLRSSRKRDFAGAQVMRGKARLPTSTRMFRNVISERPREESMVVASDLLWLCMLGRYGGSHYHHDIRPSAYRQHAGGVWSSLPRTVKSMHSIDTAFVLYKYFTRVGEPQIAAYHWRKFFWKSVLAYLRGDCAA